MKANHLCLGVVAAACANALATDLPDLGLRISGSATFVEGVWQYRYTFTNTSELEHAPTLLIVSEALRHEGTHDEFNILRPGEFGYDAPPVIPLTGISGHNYRWVDPVLPGNATVVFGFDDVHGPALVNWGAMVPVFEPGNFYYRYYVETRPAEFLPVPGVPGPAGVGVLCLGGIVAARRRGQA